MKAMYEYRYESMDNENMPKLNKLRNQCPNIEQFNK